MTSQTFESIAGTSTHLTYSPIYWQKNTLREMTIEKSSFLVPVKIKGIQEGLFMQFDLGISRTMLYGNTLSAFCKKYPELQKDTVNKGNYIVFNNAKISVSDSIILSADNLYVKKDFGQSRIDTSVVIIGSFGYDIIGDNYLILDFKSNRYAISENIPLEMESKASYVDKVDLNSFPIILPFKFGKKKIRLFYDTGSSMFPIVTGTNRLKKISMHRKIKEVHSVSSWGKEIPVYRPIETKSKIGNLIIGNIDLGKPEVYGLKTMNKLRFLGSYLYGITGNVIFNDKILIINRRKNSLGIID
jgi:hypothetical protein